MAINSQCRVLVTCSARFNTVTKTWGEIGWHWFGPKHPALPVMLKQMIDAGMALHEENGVTYTFTPLDNIETLE